MQVLCLMVVLLLSKQRSQCSPWIAREYSFHRVCSLQMRRFCIHEMRARGLHECACGWRLHYRGLWLRGFLFLLTCPKSLKGLFIFVLKFYLVYKWGLLYQPPLDDEDLIALKSLILHQPLSPALSNT